MKFSSVTALSLVLVASLSKIADGSKLRGTDERKLGKNYSKSSGSSKKSSSSKNVPTFHLTMTPENAVAPFVGPAGESGYATITFPWEAGKSPQACIDASGSFKPSLSHIHVAGDLTNPLGSNGAVAVAFTDLIDGKDVYGCVDIDETTYESILSEPGLYYADYHMADKNMQIRGQLIQGYTTECYMRDMLTVYPFMDAPAGTRGSGAVLFEKAGTRACIYFELEAGKKWTPAAWHFHNGTPGQNGPLKLAFNELVDGMSAEGCVDIEQSLSNEILLDQGSYYFDFHGDGDKNVKTSDFYKVLRCSPLNAKKSISEI